MPSRAPRHEATEKREQLSRRKEALVRAIRTRQSQEKVLLAAEKYRTANLSFLKAKLYWANEELIVAGRGVSKLEAEAASVTVKSNIERLETEIASWSGKSAEDVLRESALA